MRRGQSPRRQLPEGQSFTKAELLDAAEISPKTFDTIRKAARVTGPGHGGMNWEFSVEEVCRLITRAESGTFSERGLPAARGWRKLLEERGFAGPKP